MGQRDDIDELIGKVWGERYEIQEFVGRGGMGSVFKARHLQMDRTVALKVIHRRLTQDEKQVRRFEQEARTSSKLNHPNSIRVYDYGTGDDGRLFMAMEFLHGDTLGQTISTQGPLPPNRVAHISRQIFKSLAEAHQLGLVHRDLKPENIVICEIYGEQDFVKVLDFGIAKAIGHGSDQASLTQTGFICGTPRYLSPEQALGQDVDGRADLYSVGVLMYEMLTGRPPFVGENPISIVMKHVHDDPPPLTGLERYGEQGRRLTWLVESLLKKTPNRRPSPGERIVAFLDGRIDEAELMGRSTVSSATVTAGLQRFEGGGGSQDRRTLRDFADDAVHAQDIERAQADGEDLAPPPLPMDALLETGDISPSAETSLLQLSDTNTQPPLPPQVPASDQTALIARPESLAGDDTRTSGEIPTAEPGGATRIMSAESVGLVQGQTAPGTAPWTDDDGDATTIPDAAKRLRARAALEEASGAELSGDPVWAWAVAGVAVALLILSGLFYWWVPGPTSNIPQVATAPTRPPTPSPGPKAAAQEPKETVELTPSQRLAVARGVSAAADASVEDNPVEIPPATGRTVGTALAQVRPSQVVQDLAPAAPEPGSAAPQDPKPAAQPAPRPTTKTPPAATPVGKPAPTRAGPATRPKPVTKPAAKPTRLRPAGEQASEKPKKPKKPKKAKKAASPASKPPPKKPKATPKKPKEKPSFDMF